MGYCELSVLQSSTDPTQFQGNTLGTEHPFSGWTEAGREMFVLDKGYGKKESSGHIKHSAGCGLKLEASISAAGFAPNEKYQVLFFFFMPPQSQRVRTKKGDNDL